LRSKALKMLDNSLVTAIQVLQTVDLSLSFRRQACN
jgi:hypothetical protein